MEEELSDKSAVPLGAGLKVGIVCNLKNGSIKSSDDAPDADAEFDNPATVQAIQNALAKHGIVSVIMEADEHLPENIRKKGISFAFNIAEGKNGRNREAQVPALLEMMGVPYTGSDAFALSVALDKAMCKRLLSTYGVRTARYSVIAPGDGFRIPELCYPVIVKPNAEGSGKGISESSIAESPEELKEILQGDMKLYGEDMLVEEYLPGREFTVGLLGNGDSLKVFPPMEVIYKGNTQRCYKVYSYKVKCNYTDYIDYKCPAELDPCALEEMTAAARTVFIALGCKDVARIDFRMDSEGHPCFLEINPLPGLAPIYSDLPMIAEACGLDYDSLVFEIFDSAVKRSGLQNND